MTGTAKHLTTRAVRWQWVALGIVSVAAIGCASDERSPAEGVSQDAQDCVDRDGDGFGNACELGADCDDHDQSIQRGCLRCATPAEGCACAEGTAPDSCYLDKTKDEDGNLMCHEGTRYCREGLWSGCESIHSYPLPQRSTTAVIDPDGGSTSTCNDCSTNCHTVVDNNDPVDGGLGDAGMGVDWDPGGGLTLDELPDGGPPPPPPEEQVPCTIGAVNSDDTDCDGIPNIYDPYPDDAPFFTANPAIFLDIAPGQTGTGAIDLQFNMNSADVYFLVDQSGSMDQERDQLVADLTTGTFITDPKVQCADYDFDRLPNNEQKQKGIVGAIRCKIRDASFGVGFFRELPFDGYASDDHIVFANYHDISADVDSVRDAINRLTTVGNEEWPEASMVALNTVLTGNPIYLGTTLRGVPRRTNCAPTTWGYPCFRQGAIPIVVLFTDAQFHNGPDNNSFAYPATFPIKLGKDSKYIPLATTNEDFPSPADLGDLTNSYTTFTGNTGAMRADLNANTLSTCLSSADGTDAMFKFELKQRRDVTIESTGSRYDTVLGLFTAGVPGSPTALPTSTDGNEDGPTALPLGQAYNSFLTITGNTGAMAHEYQWSTIECGAATDAPDAVFKFNLSQKTTVALDSSGSSFDTVLGLFAAEPALPPAYTPIANTNDAPASAYPVPGDIVGQFKAFNGSTASLADDYSAEQVSCGAVDAGKDAAFNFTLSAPKRVRISSEGSSFDTVLALFDGIDSPMPTLAVPATNERQASAFDIGTLDGQGYRLTGTTASMAADYFGANHIGCNANAAARDAVFKFHLDAPRNIQIDSTGTWDSVLALYGPDQSFETAIGVTATSNGTGTNTNEALASAQNIVPGSTPGPMNGQDYLITGNTAGMASDYGSSSNACLVSNSTSSPDAFYRFSLASPTSIRLDMTGSSFDTTVALHSLPPAEPISAVPGNSNDTQWTATDVGTVTGKSFVWTGNTGALTHDYDLSECSAHASARDAVFKFSVTGTTDREIQIDTDGDGTTAFDTVIGLYPATVQPAVAPTTVAVTGNTTSDDANDLGTANNLWKIVSGSTTGAGNESADTTNHCSSSQNSPDSYHKFTVTGPGMRSINLALSGAYNGAKMLLYKTSVAAGSNYQTCNSSSITRDLSAGTYYVVIKGTGSSSNGAYTLTLTDTALPGSYNRLECDNNDGSGNNSLLVRTLSPGTYHVVVSGRNASNTSSKFSLRFRDNDWWNTFGYEACDDNGGGGVVSKLNRSNLPAGDYGILVKGHRNGDYGPYSLRVTDTGSPPIGPVPVVCNDDGGGSPNPRITRSSLPAGDYYILLKGDADADAGSYTLTVRDTDAARSTIVQCDDDGGDAPRSVIERDLLAGTYQVVLKGKRASDAGAYKISFRDMAAHPISRLACDNDSGAGTSSFIQRNLDPGTYYVTLKGNEPSSSGAYALSVRDVDRKTIPSAICNDNASSSSFGASRIVQNLNPGIYFVAVKGKTGADSGDYQLSIGGGTTTTAGTYRPPLWASTLAAVQSTKARVIPILSCQDDPEHGDAEGDCKQARSQATQLAKASDALGANLAPLVFDIDSDGTGLSDKVVGAVSELAKYLEMDVEVRLKFEPDANPGFNIILKAIDQVGDGCDGLEGLEHQDCVPGASPRFVLEFENPLDNPVEKNTRDPLGGYNFVAELIGDGKFIVDRVPIYIIPASVAPPGPPPPQYYTHGTYKQDVVADACSGNEGPDWSDLRWTASVYAGTSVSFSVCAAADAAGLQSCTPSLVAKVSGTNPCTTDMDCPVGYCAASTGVCQVATGKNCTVDANCTTNSFCDPDSLLCTYERQPVYIGGSLGADNYKPFMRMLIGLDATPPVTNPPVLQNWEITYQCRNVQ
jgi:hypothetical protein